MKPQITKREAQALAQQAESDPLGVLQQIAEREADTYISLTFYGPSYGWNCGLSFSGATNAVLVTIGRGETSGAAVKQAILRAYDTGAEKGWQLRDKSFQGGGLT